MSGTPTITRFGLEAVPRLEELWNALYAHHGTVGGAGLPMIPPEESWPLRRAHYAHLFETAPHADILLATNGDESDGAPIAYALSFDDELLGTHAVVLETLSVSPAARGAGLGTRLMDEADRLARARGATLAAVDVLGGNDRARALYLRVGYAPYSESWLRTRAMGAASLSTSVAPPGNDLTHQAASLGFELTFSPGPDDTWVSSDWIAELTPGGTSGDASNEDARVPTIDPAALATLLDRLATAGAWTARVTIPASPQAGALRGILVDLGFRMSTERLLRAL